MLLRRNITFSSVSWIPVVSTHCAYNSGIFLLPFENFAIHIVSRGYVVHEPSVAQGSDCLLTRIIAGKRERGLHSNNFEARQKSTEKPYNSGFLIVRGVARTCNITETVHHGNDTPLTNDGSIQLEGHVLTSELCCCSDVIIMTRWLMNHSTWKTVHRSTVDFLHHDWIP